MLLTLGGQIVPVIDERGLPGLNAALLAQLPYPLVMAVAYYLPAALVLGFGLTRLMDRLGVFGLRLVWAIAGLALASPVIWMLATAFGLPPFDDASVHIAAVGVGMAGRWGYREVAAKPT